MSTKLKLLLSVLGYLLVCWYSLSHRRGALEASVAMPLRPAAGACAQEPSLSLRLEGGRPVIGGSLPDLSARENIHARAVALYGSDGFDDHLTVSSLLRQAGWVSLAPTLLTQFRRIGGDASLSVRARTVVVAGAASSDAERAEVLQRVRAAVPGDVELVDRLTLQAPEPPVAPVAPVAALPVAALPVAAVPGDSAIRALQAQIDAVTAGRSLEFVPNSDALAPTNGPLLDAVAGVLHPWPMAVIAVEGHTDNAGNLDITRDVGARHAASVVRALMARGIDRRQMRVHAPGASRPIADNGTPEGRQRNRRIEFRVLRGG